MKVKKVPLGRDGSAGAALVSANDYQRVMDAGIWSLHINGYAYRTVLEDGRSRTEYLHRFVLGLQPGDGLQVDHISGNRLDNTRGQGGNLRICTASENAQNKTQAIGRSPYRGVSVYGSRWRASVSAASGERLRKVFETEIEAAEWAEQMRAKHQPFSSPDPLLATV